MKRFTLALGVAMLAACSAGLAGCAHHAPSAQDAQAPAFIYVQNELSNGYQLYFSDGSRRLDAGKIGPLESVRIQVPPSLVYPGARLALIALPSTSARTLSIPFVIHPGATVRLLLGR